MTVVFDLFSCLYDVGGEDIVDFKDFLYGVDGLLWVNIVVVKKDFEEVACEKMCFYGLFKWGKGSVFLCCEMVDLLKDGSGECFVV